MDKMLDSKEELKRAVDLFVKGWMYCRRKPATQLKEFDSYKHIDFGTDVGGRTEEFFVWDSKVKHIIEDINKQHGQTDQWLTVFSDEKPNNGATEGYILTNSEFLMILDVENCLFETDDKAIKRVKTEEEAKRINDFLGKEAIDLEKLNDSHLHYYVGEEQGELTSHGCYSLLDKTVCLDKIFTAETHRGKGIAKSLCRKMLLDAKQEGAVKSVLASSQMGHPLYLKLGYRDVSTMWMFERQC